MIIQRAKQNHSSISRKAQRPKPLIPGAKKVPFPPWCLMGRLWGMLGQWKNQNGMEDRGKLSFAQREEEKSQPLCGTPSVFLRRMPTPRHFEDGVERGFPSRRKLSLSHETAKGRYHFTQQAINKYQMVVRLPFLNERMNKCVFKFINGNYQKPILQFKLFSVLKFEDRTDMNLGMMESLL